MTISFLFIFAFFFKDYLFLHILLPKRRFIFFFCAFSNLSWIFSLSFLSLMSNDIWAATRCCMLSIPSYHFRWLDDAIHCIYGMVLFSIFCLPNLKEINEKDSVGELDACLPLDDCHNTADIPGVLTFLNEGCFGYGSRDRWKRSYCWESGKGTCIIYF